MTVPAFLLPLHTFAPLAILSTAAAATSVAAGGPSSVSLPGFSVQIQLQANWCWAAVSTSVAVFFGSSNWTQCEVAAAELSPLQCCGADASTGCNIPWYLDTALARVGHFDRIIASTSPFMVVQTEINKGSPLGCRIAWSGGGAHFVALGGWLIASDATEYVDVHDPYYGLTQKRHADFVSAYRSLGDAWTHSYLTRATAAAAAAAGGMAPGPHSPKSA